MSRYLRSDFIVPITLVVLAFGGYIVASIYAKDESAPSFVVSEMVQCRGSICNAVLEMDDIAILIPFDSTRVHVGDRLFLRK